MKLHGKGKIFSRQSPHIYLRISRNLEDEIFPKGVGVVTPKILLDFSKKFIWLEGGDLKFFFKRTLLFKIFFYGKSFIWIHPRLVFGLGGSCFLFWTQAKILFTWEKCLLEIPLKMPYGFWNDSLPLSTFSLTMALVQIHSPKPSLIFGSWFASNPASWTSLYDYFPFNLIKTISVFYSSPWRFTKELPFLFWFLPPNLFPS